MTEPTASAPIPAPPILTAPMLSVEDVTVSFDGFTVLDSLDFGLEQGELRFIIGPNGAGETTLLDLITGKTKPDRGRITCNGDTDLTRWQEHDRVRLGIGRKFQTPSVFISLTVYENLEVSVGFRSRWGRLFRSVSRQDRDWIKSAQEQVGLSERSDVPAGALSHGEKQWLEIGMLLAQEPRLLLLDEPAEGLQPSIVQEIEDLIIQLQERRRTSVLLVEQSLDIAMTVSETTVS